jgi:MGT family glycosyltransferase
MGRALVLAYPTHGHLAPILPVAAELARRGEEVVFYGTGRSRARIEAAGARFRLYPRRHDDFSPTPPTEGLFNDMARLSALTADILPGLLEDARTAQPDYLLIDTKSLWGRLVGAILGIPAVTLSVVFAIQPESLPVPALVGYLYHGAPPAALRSGLLALGEYLETARLLGRKYGVALPGIVEYLGNPQPLNLIFTSREFQLNGPSFGDAFRFVGPSIPPGRDVAIDFPFDRLTGAPLLYVSLGTTFNRAPEFYRACFEAFAAMPWQVVLSTGGAPAAELGSPPANFLVREFVPQLPLLERADAFLTHGGMNSANEGLWHGVPLIVVPQRGDQHVVAARVAELGAGLRVLPHEATPERLREAAAAVLGEPAFRERARELGATLRAAGGYVRAADEVIDFARQEAVTLFRPTGEQELVLIRDSGWRAFPPRLPDQPFFYPVLNEEYAAQIARDWNTRDGGAGYVLRFQVNAAFLARYTVQTVGSRVHKEYWIPAEDLEEFNRNLIGSIDVVTSFREVSGK